MDPPTRQRCLDTIMDYISRLPGQYGLAIFQELLVHTNDAYLCHVVQRLAQEVSRQPPQPVHDHHMDTIPEMKCIVSFPDGGESFVELSDVGETYWDMFGRLTGCEIKSCHKFEARITLIKPLRQWNYQRLPQDRNPDVPAIENILIRAPSYNPVDIAPVYHGDPMPPSVPLMDNDQLAFIHPVTRVRYTYTIAISDALSDTPADFQGATQPELITPQQSLATATTLTSGSTSASTLGSTSAPAIPIANTGPVVQTNSAGPTPSGPATPIPVINGVPANGPSIRHTQPTHSAPQITGPPASPPTVPSSSPPTSAAATPRPAAVGPLP